MNPRSLVLTEIQRVAEEQHKELAPLTDDLPLLQSGLDSLCLAVLVARLSEELGIDPFDSADDETSLPVTVGDFVALYARDIA